MLMIRGLDLTTKEILLYGANMKLEKGFVYGLSARNGSGKTTLLRTISGLRKESIGSIMIIENDCILQAKSLEECSEKFRTLPALMFLVISYSIKRVSHGNCHQ